MSPTTLRRLLVGAVIGVCVVIVFLAGTGTAPSPQSATTVPSTTVPWVDRTTAIDDDLEPSRLAERVASLQAWLVENRGLPFLRPLDVKILHEPGREALGQELRDGKDYEWPSYGLVPPLFGVEGGPDDWWGVTTLTDAVVVGMEIADLIFSEALIYAIVPTLTDQHYHHLERMDALFRAGLVGDEVDALRTLVWGDATFTSSGFGRTMATGEDWVPAGGGCLSPRTLGFRSYLWAGSSYVCRLYAEGGWDRVNQAYTDPPKSTAEILGIECSAQNTPLTPIDWPVRFEASRGPLWFNMMVGGDISRISGWCADHQRVVGDSSLQFMVMEIWLGSPDDAAIVERETLEFFAAADDELESLVVRDGSWVGVASTLSTLNLCSQLPGWCP